MVVIIILNMYTYIGSTQLASINNIKYVYIHCRHTIYTHIITDRFTFPILPKIDLFMVVTITKYNNQYNHSKILITFQIPLHYNHQNINYIPNTIIRRILLYFEKATHSHTHTRSRGPEVCSHLYFLFKT